MRTRTLAGKLAYFALFWFVVPALLTAWAAGLEPVIALPPVHAPTVGFLLAAAGLALIAWSSLWLWTQGGGLPMNAFPPESLVQSGPYGLLRDPIYLGAAMICAGASLMAGSAAGLWVVTPVFIAYMAALLLGYERLDLAARFPDWAAFTPLFAIPPATDAPTDMARRFAALAMPLLLWILFNALFARLLGSPHAAASTHAVIPAAWLALVALTPLTAVRAADLRSWVLRSYIALGVTAFGSLLLHPTQLAALTAFPGSAPTFDNSLLGPPLPLVWISLAMLARRRTPGWMATAGVGAIGVVIGLVVLGGGNSVSSTPLWAPSWAPPWAILLAVALAASLAVATIALGSRHIWNGLRAVAQTLANSWTEWTIGPVRIINHGFYVGFAAFAGITAAGFLTGRLYAWAILAFSVTVVVVSALWAQLIEGSDKLKRPFGYYGALVGILFGSGILRLMDADVWMVLAIVSVLIPWVQAVGRMRCLINGCCHGAPTLNPRIGIHYEHPRSRVLTISGLGGRLLHPTPLYSILWLFACGLVMMSLWWHRMPPSFLLGMYLILTGIGRFVEEAYRGEAQTRILHGLRLYQWTAILSVLVGIAVTVWPTPDLAPTPGFNTPSLLAGLLGGCFVFVAMGVDFPRSNARFSRLV